MKKIIITGASRGIGREIAICLAKMGHQIFLIARNEELLSEVLKEVRKCSLSSQMFVGDISEKRFVEKVVDEIITNFQTIDVLINNAGIQAPIGNFKDISFEEWVNNFNVNLFAPAYFIKLLLPVMARNKHKGKIINFSGGGSTSPRPNFSAYAVSKTAIVRLTETLSEEFASQKINIDINTVAPGAINTSMLDEVIEAGEKAGDEFNLALERKRKGTADYSKIIRLIKFLISEKADGISGKLISAPWDDWENEKKLEKFLNDKNFATLRRIDDKFFGEL